MITIQLALIACAKVEKESLRIRLRVVAVEEELES